MSKILIVEDEVMVQTFLKSNLSKHYEIAGTAVSGEEAIDLVAKHQPDIVLMDINLEGKMDGIEAAQKISEENDVAILFLTSRTDDDTVERAKMIKPFGYISKPVDFNVLKSNIDIALSMYKELVKSPIGKSLASEKGESSSLEEINRKVSESVEEVSMEWKDKNRIEIVNNRFLRQYWVLESNE